MGRGAHIPKCIQELIGMAHSEGSLLLQEIPKHGSIFLLMVKAKKSLIFVTNVPYVCISQNGYSFLWNNSDRWVWVLRPKLLTPIQTKSDQFFFKSALQVLVFTWFDIFITWARKYKKLATTAISVYFYLKSIFGYFIVPPPAHSEIILKSKSTHGSSYGVGGGDWHYTVKYRKEQPSLKSEVHLLDDSAIFMSPI